MKIFLVRHGEAAAKWQHSDDPGLSARGRQQAAATAQALAARVDPQVRLLSSPLLRARETAEPLSRVLGKPVSIVDAFREIPTPVPIEERQNWLKSIARQDWSEQHPLVLDWHKLLLRQLDQIRHPVVVFTHFMVLNAIVGSLSGTENVICFMPDNASITTLQMDGGSWSLLDLGRQLDKDIE